MIGKVIGIEENIVYIKLNDEIIKTKDLIHHYVSLTTEDKKIIGEIINIKEDVADVNLVGQMENNEFIFGVIVKPSFSSSVELVPDHLVKNIISVGDYDETKDLYLGKSPIYKNLDVSVNINKFFSQHFAIFGSTGTGKSCGVARILQNLFSKENPLPYKASIFMFDAYGEYHTAFQNLNKKYPYINFKTYTTSLDDQNSELLRIPLWLMGVDDIALLLGADKHSQIQIIEKALKLVTIFAQEEKNVIKSKNDIIARALLDILSSGRSSTAIRDQIFSVLSYYNTSELNLDTEIEQPGYTRPLKHCMNIDASGKIREMELIMNFISKFLTDDYVLTLPDGSFKYNLNDLKDAFDFALISEGVLKSDKIYDEANVLKVRIHSLANGDESVYFDYPEYITRDEYIKSLLTTKNGYKAQIINFNINYIDDRLAKNITKIYSKLLFDYAKGLKDRASSPFHIILEEAHRYVQNDNDNFLLGYNIFERITKEGRKYGVILGLISQRPSELSETSLSQCSNFLIFRMLHPRDIEYVKEIVPNITTETIKKLKILQPGSCVAFGSAFKVPVIISLDMPSPSPSSGSCDIRANWFVRKK
jgi:DNA helicase HerA-like ATPase